MAEVISFSARAATKPARKPKRTHDERSAAAIRSHDTRRVNKARAAFSDVPWLFKELEREIEELIARRMAEAKARLAHAYEELAEVQRELHARPPAPKVGA